MSDEDLLMGALAMGLNVLMVLALVLAFSNSGRLLGPRPVHEGDAELPYETGEPPFRSAAGHMAVLYYRFAVVFVVFDVDLAFLLPWAVNGRAASLGQLASVTFFVAIVSFMLAYLWKKGVLECH